MTLPKPTEAELVAALRAFADPTQRHSCDCRFCKASLLVQAWDEHNAPEPPMAELIRTATMGAPATGEGARY